MIWPITIPQAGWVLYDLLSESQKAVVDQSTYSDMVIFKIIAGSADVAIGFNSMPVDNGYVITAGGRDAFSYKSLKLVYVKGVGWDSTGNRLVTF